jgi:hypothetical protein
MGWRATYKAVGDSRVTGAMLQMLLAGNRQEREILDPLGMALLPCHNTHRFFIPSN